MCSPLKIRGALCKGLAGGPQQLLSDGSTRGEEGAEGGERDAKFRPRRTSSAEGQKDCGGAPARSRLHEKETSGRSGKRGKISMERDDGTFEGLGPCVWEVSRCGGGVTSGYCTWDSFIPILQ